MKFATLVLACAVLASVEARPKNTSAVKTWKQGFEHPEEVCYDGSCCTSGNAGDGWTDEPNGGWCWCCGDE